MRYHGEVPSASSGYQWLRDETWSVRERFARVVYLVQELVATGQEDQARALFAAALDFLSAKRASGEIPGATVDDARALLARWPALREGGEGERRVGLLAIAKRATMELRVVEEEEETTNRIRLPDK